MPNWIKIFQRHGKVLFSFNGAHEVLTFNALTKMQVPLSKPSNHLTNNCKPLAEQVRKYFFKDDKEYYTKYESQQQERPI